MDLLREATRAAAGERARPGPGPSRERLAELAQAVASRRYRVDPLKVAEVLLDLTREDRSARRG